MDFSRRSFPLGALAATQALGSGVSSEQDMQQNPNPSTAGAPAQAFQFRADGTTLRTVRAKLEESVSIKDFGAVGDGAADDTEAFERALKYLESLPRGGEMYLPPGIYKASFDLSRQAADFTKRITITGAGRCATQLWPKRSAAIVVNMVGRNLCTLRDLTVYAGDEYEAEIGILLARSTYSTSCNSNNFSNIEVVGNYSKSAVLSIAAENGFWHSCLFWNNNRESGYSCFITGSHPNLLTTNASYAGLNLIASVNTAVRMVSCDFYAPYDGAAPFVASRAASYTFVNCNWGCPGSAAMIRLTDPDRGTISANLKFFGSHFEGGRSENSSIFRIEGEGTVSLKGLTDIGSVIVGASGMSYLDYDRDRSSLESILGIEDCHLQPGRSLGDVVGLNLYADIADRCVIDWTNIGPMGSILIFAQARHSRLYGSSIVVSSTTNTFIDYAATAQPTSGVFPEGAFVRNEAPTVGEPLGWVALHGGSMDTGDIHQAAIANGTNRLVFKAAADVYEGAKLWIEHFGFAVVRKKAGETLFMSLDVNLVSSAVQTHFSQKVGGSFAPVGIVGGGQAAPVADSDANDLRGLTADFNALLANLRAANLVGR